MSVFSPISTEESQFVGLNSKKFYRTKRKIFFVKESKYTIYFHDESKQKATQ